jgi:hypothetical protein
MVLATGMIKAIVIDRSAALLAAFGLEPRSRMVADLGSGLFSTNSFSVNACAAASG